MCIKAQEVRRVRSRLGLQEGIAAALRTATIGGKHFWCVPVCPLASPPPPPRRWAGGALFFGGGGGGRGLAQGRGGWLCQSVAAPIGLSPLNLLL